MGYTGMNKSGKSEYIQDSYPQWLCCHDLAVWHNGFLFQRICEHCSWWAAQTLITTQGELAHCNLKAKYRQTSKKGYKKQLAQIEHRQAWIHCIQEKLNPTRIKEIFEQGLDGALKHYHIGKTENHPQHISLFLEAHAGDPATEARL